MATYGYQHISDIDMLSKMSVELGMFFALDRGMFAAGVVRDRLENEPEKWRIKAYNLDHSRGHAAGLQTQRSSVYMGTSTAVVDTATANGEICIYLLHF